MKDSKLEELESILKMGIRFTFTPGGILWNSYAEYVYECCSPYLPGEIPSFDFPRLNLLFLKVCEILMQCGSWEGQETGVEFLSSLGLRPDDYAEGSSSDYDEESDDESDDPAFYSMSVFADGFPASWRD
jgi:hypothetical protein